MSKYQKQNEILRLKVAILSAALVVLSIILFLDALSIDVYGAYTSPVGTKTASPPVELVFYYNEDDIIAMAKMLYRECGGVKSVTEQACVAWIACNWADEENNTDYVGMIKKSVTKRGRFDYRTKAPVTDHLYELASDVLFRWNLEKNGYHIIGRVIPSDFFYFAGDGTHNYFRRNFKGDRNFWDYSLESPYDMSA